MIMMQMSHRHAFKGYSSCGNSPFCVIRDGNSEKCHTLDIGCLQLLLLAGIDICRQIRYMILSCMQLAEEKISQFSTQSHLFQDYGYETSNSDVPEMTNMTLKFPSL